MVDPIFDGLVASLGCAQAGDKALYVLSSLTATNQKQQIEGATVGQVKNALWSAYRKKRITASNFGLVLAAVKSYPPSLFKTLLGQYILKQGSKVSSGISHFSILSVHESPKVLLNTALNVFTMISALVEISSFGARIAVGECP
ncbi:hypothetical protein SKAU_G00411920 [Synaphobranchus kaupii]|uniref:Uncharacterized protein n=1 Tax=Synaphobranchus kaupii TaxID=118154 RepID=A0A9Q1E7X5_SYNKA|nr:hypothetical protein SKAU_G00411920 [Synaphobranchus kaupii]